MAEQTPVPEPTDEEWNAFWGNVRNYGKDGCWTWIGRAFTQGYGYFMLRGQPRRAHRVAYVWTHGEPGMGLDHLCENRLCVNPEHLEPKSPWENVRRSRTSPAAVNARKTHCANGHPLSGENLYIDPKRGWRQCRICKTTAALRSQQARRDEINARRRARRAASTSS